MNKISGVARRILGWKLNRWDRWYDFEKQKFIPILIFNQRRMLKSCHAHSRMSKSNVGYTYTIKSPTEVHFNDISGKGHTLAQAITRNM